MLINASQPRQPGRGVSRRVLLGVMAGAAVGVAGASGATGYLALGRADRHPVVLASIAQVEAARRRSGRTVSAELTARRAEVDPGG